MIWSEQTLHLHLAPAPSAPVTQCVCVCACVLCVRVCCVYLGAVVVIGVLAEKEFENSSHETHLLVQKVSNYPHTPTDPLISLYTHVEHSFLCLIE